MKSNKELKDETLKNLAKYPKVEKFFKDSLEERIDLGIKLNENWLENPLILLLQDTLSLKQSKLHTLIESISSDKENFNILRSKLNPKDQYDTKIKDVLAELHAYYRIKKDSFTNIKALPEDSSRRKPDFSAQYNDQLYLFEVKNMRAPIEVCDFLLVKAQARANRFPGTYQVIGIYFTASQRWLEVEFNRQETEALKKEVEDWLEQTFTTIEHSEAPASGCIEPFNLKSQGLTIECNLKKGENIGALCSLKRGVLVSDPDYQQRVLLPFSEKVRRIASDASGQLLEYDEDNVHKKHVLLNWQKSFKLEGLVWTGFENNVHEIIKSIDLEVKNLSVDLFVKLLNFDSLP
jgi:hypothetical protein